MTRRAGRAPGASSRDHEIPQQRWVHEEATPSLATPKDQPPSIMRKKEGRPPIVSIAVGRYTPSQLSIRISAWIFVIAPVSTSISLLPRRVLLGLSLDANDPSNLGRRDGCQTNDGPDTPERCTNQCRSQSILPGSCCCVVFCVEESRGIGGVRRVLGSVEVLMKERGSSTNPATGSVLTNLPMLESNQRAR
jgi:hypothetical protein